MGALVFSLTFGGYVSSAEPVFVEVATPAGLDFVHNQNGITQHLPSITPGAALGDYDNDGWVDVYICNGWGYANGLYRNNGNGTFTNVAALVGADLEMVERESKCPLFLDYDGDGWLDLFIAHDGDPDIGTPSDTLQHSLLRNLGDGQFEDTTGSAQIPPHPYQNLGQGFTLVGGVSAGDLNGDGYPEIYISYWRDHDTLLLNNGDGTFTDISEAAVIDPYGRNSFCALMWDADQDGLTDIYVAVDYNAPNELLINQGGTIPTFVDQAPEAGLDTAWSEMGTALGDYDNDGDLDLYMTTIQRPPDSVGNDDPVTEWNRLYRNDGIGGDFSFVDVGPDLDVHRTGWGWGTVFVDYNNDGWTDIAAVNGNATGDPVYQTDASTLFRNEGGTAFTDVSDVVGFNDTRIARALMAFDYDRDGDRDLLVTNYLDAALLYRNDGGDTAGNWVVVDPIGQPPNTRAIGALVYIEAGGLMQVRMICAGSSFLTQEPDEAHFGLGVASTIDSIRVVWPDGTEDLATNVPSNQYIEFIQGVGIPLGPQGEAVSLAITGPSTVIEGATVTYTATATYESDAEENVTDQASWIVMVGAEHAEFSAANPGELAALLLANEMETADVTVQAAFESLVDTLDVSIVESDMDVVGPTLAITGPTTEAEMIVEESTVTLTGTVEDGSGVMAVVWSTDQEISGPCSGLVDWSTGPIPLTDGVNLITITGRDGLQNEASVDLMVTYTVPEPSVEPELPVDPEPSLMPEPPVDPEPPMDHAPTDAPVAPDAPADEPDDTTPVDPGGDEMSNGDPTEATGNDAASYTDRAVRVPPSGLCGAMVLFSSPMILVGLRALRRRAA